MYKRISNCTMQKTNPLNLTKPKPAKPVLRFCEHFLESKWEIIQIPISLTPNNCFPVFKWNKMRLQRQKIYLNTLNILKHTKSAKIFILLNGTFSLLLLYETDLYRTFISAKKKHTQMHKPRALLIIQHQTVFFFFWELHVYLF